MSYQPGIAPLNSNYRGIATFPLLRAVVNYDIVDVNYYALVKHKFKSGATEDLELVYNFPLPPDASVCSYRAVINHNRVVKGVLQTKEKAKKAYDKAIKAGKTATYLQQVNAEIFQISLGNVKPKQTMTIQIGLVGTITHDGGFDSMRLTFPVTIAPRYGIAPAALSKGSEGVSPLEINVAIEMTAPIQAISSPSHPIQAVIGNSVAEDNFV